MDDEQHEYREPVATLLTLGDLREQPRYDYGSLGLGEAHIAELTRLAVDRDLYWGDSESDEVWAPIHAWRALADLGADSSKRHLLRCAQRPFLAAPLSPASLIDFLPPHSYTPSR